MHEMSTCRALIAKIEEIAAQQQARSVKKVNLRNGYFSTVDVDEVKYLFPLVAKGTIASTAELLVEQQLLEAECADCVAHFILDDPGGNCPICGSFDTRLCADQGLVIVDLEVEI